MRRKPETRNLRTAALFRSQKCILLRIRNTHDLLTGGVRITNLTYTVLRVCCQTCTNAGTIQRGLTRSTGAVRELTVQSIAMVQSARVIQNHILVSQDTTAGRRSVIRRNVEYYALPGLHLGDTSHLVAEQA
jgi:hypothetical protein